MTIHLCRLRYAARAALVLAVLTGPTAPAVAQVRGPELAALLARERLVTTEGLTYARWLPDGAMYTRKTTPAGMTPEYVRVDPESGERSPALSPNSWDT